MSPARILSSVIIRWSAKIRRGNKSAYVIHKRPKWISRDHVEVGVPTRVGRGKPGMETDFRRSYPVEYLNVSSFDCAITQPNIFKGGFPLQEKSKWNVQRWHSLNFMFENLIAPKWENTTLKFSLRQRSLPASRNEEGFPPTSWSSMFCGHRNLAWENACKSISAFARARGKALFRDHAKSLYLESDTQVRILGRTE